MLINFSKEDILNSLKILNIDNTLIDQTIEINNLIIINKQLPIGALTMEIQILPVDNYLEINITKAQILGQSAFGVIRKIAGDFILSTLNPFQAKIKSFKTKNGNIGLQMPNVKITQASCKNGILSINLEL